MGGTYIEIKKEILVIKDYSLTQLSDLRDDTSTLLFFQIFVSLFFYAGTVVEAPCNLAWKVAWRLEVDVLPLLGADVLFEGKKNSVQFSVVSTPTGMEVSPPLPYDRV